jgi:8-oxo-dGTP pyrophosphatase MutT (NUDIX family)
LAAWRTTPRTPEKCISPAGTPEPRDVRPDQTVDLAGSVLRELTEETGLTATDVDQTDRWVAVFAGARTALMREVCVPREAEAARADILAFLAGDAEPELCDICIVRSPDDIDISAMPPFMQAYLRFALEREGHR